MLWDTAGIQGRYKFKAEEIEAISEWDGEPGEFVKAMEKVRLLDREDGQYKIHDYLEHCPQYYKIKITKTEQKKEEEEKEEPLDTVRIGRDWDIYSVSDEQLINLCLMLPGEVKAKNSSKLLENVVKKALRTEEGKQEVRDILKYIYDCQNYGEEKDLGELKNPKGFLIKKLNNFNKGD
jgi:hypothetical protein